MLETKKFAFLGTIRLDRSAEQRGVPWNANSGPYCIITCNRPRRRSSKNTFRSNPGSSLPPCFGTPCMTEPFRKAKNPGSGKHYQSPHRLHSIDVMRRDSGRSLYKVRTRMERSFGNATSFGGGLGPLPAWVRGLERVRTWVWAKLLINAVRGLIHKDLRHP
jgi:hypothetical protein